MAFSVTRNRRTWWIVSTVLVAVSILGMAVSWLQTGAPIRPGLDFRGGTKLQFERDCSKARCDQPLSSGAIQEALDRFKVGGGSSVQIIGREQEGMVIRTASLDPDVRNALQLDLERNFGPFDPKLTQIDTVGPLLGQQLLQSGLLALLISFVGIMVYLSFRFERDYAVIGIIALFHDVFITTGVFAWMGLSGSFEADSLFIVSLLTITGFSINDTVVIYDRIRETLQRNPEEDIETVVDLSVNQTMARSINTTLTTLLPLVAIYIFGGETLRTFALALIVGFVLGAYSSIFIASTLLEWWRQRRQPAQS